MRPKEWLVKNGHLDKVGRGRLSREHIALIEKAVAAGVKIDGYTVESKPKATATGPDKPTAVVKRESHDPNRIVEPADYRYPENGYRAFEVETGVERSMRSACNGCSLSLVMCYCEVPTIVATDGGGSVAIEIKGKR